MTLIIKPERIGQATYLRVPKECEELLVVMRARTCSVDFQIDEKGSRLVYHFAKADPDFIEQTERRPLWMTEKELVA